MNDADQALVPAACCTTRWHPDHERVVIGPMSSLHRPTVGTVQLVGGQAVRLLEVGTVIYWWTEPGAPLVPPAPPDLARVIGAVLEEYRRKLGEWPPPFPELTPEQVTKLRALQAKWAAESGRKAPAAGGQARLF